MEGVNIRVVSPVTGIMYDLNCSPALDAFIRFVNEPSESAEHTQSV